MKSKPAAVVSSLAFFFFFFLSSSFSFPPFFFSSPPPPPPPFLFFSSASVRIISKIVLILAALISASPPTLIASSMIPTFAVLACSHVGKAIFRERKALAEVASVVFCERIVRTRLSSTERQSLWQPSGSEKVAAAAERAAAASLEGRGGGGGGRGEEGGGEEGIAPGSPWSRARASRAAKHSAGEGRRQEGKGPSAGPPPGLKRSSTSTTSGFRPFFFIGGVSFIAASRRGRADFLGDESASAEASLFRGLMVELERVQWALSGGRGREERDRRIDRLKKLVSEFRPTSKFSFSLLSPLLFHAPRALLLFAWLHFNYKFTVSKLYFFLAAAAAAAAAAIFAPSLILFMNSGLSPAASSASAPSMATTSIPAALNKLTPPPSTSGLGSTTPRTTYEGGKTDFFFKGRETGERMGVSVAPPFWR